jgi:hypothetical protein
MGGGGTWPKVLMTFSRKSIQYGAAFYLCIEPRSTQDQEFTASAVVIGLPLVDESYVNQQMKCDETDAGYSIGSRPLLVKADSCLP